MAFCWTHSIVSMSCLVLEIPTPDPTLHLCLTNANRGKELFPLTYWSPSALCSPGGCGLCCKGALPVLQVPNVLFSKTAFQVLWLKHALVLGVIPPQEQNLTSSLIELYKVPVSPFLQLSKGPCMADLPYGVPVPPLTFVSSANVLRMHPAPSSRSLMRILNSAHPRI